MKLASKLTGPPAILFTLLFALLGLVLFMATGQRREIVTTVLSTQAGSAELHWLSELFADSERDLFAFRDHPDLALRRRVENANAEREDVLARLSLREWGWRGRNMLDELRTTNATLVMLQARYLELATHEDPHLAQAFVLWWFVAQKAHAIVVDLGAYNIRRLDQSLASLTSIQAQGMTGFAAMVAFAAIALLAFAMLVSRHVISPLVRLTKAAHALRVGHTTTLPVDPTRKDEIGALASTIADMADRLTLANRELRDALALRDQFLSVASHELKTPVTTLMLTAQRLQRDDSDLEQRRQSYARLLKQTFRLNDLITSLLDTSMLRLGRLQLNKRQASINELARTVATRFTPLLESTGNTLVVDAKENVESEVDVARIEQVLVNLLGNASKYAAGTRVEISVRRQGDQVELAVRDHGPGIAADVAPRLFERYARAEGTRQQSGLGLGLFLCKQLVEAHGGSIRAEAAHPGTRVVVLLPAST